MIHNEFGNKAFVQNWLISQNKECLLWKSHHLNNRLFVIQIFLQYDWKKICICFSRWFWQECFFLNRQKKPHPSLVYNFINKLICKELSRTIYQAGPLLHSPNSEKSFKTAKTCCNAANLYRGPEWWGVWSPVSDGHICEWLNSFWLW